MYNSFQSTLVTQLCQFESLSDRERAQIGTGLGFDDSRVSFFSQSEFVSENQGSMNREEGAYAHQVRSLERTDRVRSLERTERVNPWLINDHQMSEKSCDHGVIDDAEYGDMVIEMNEMTLMSECSKDDLMSEKGSDQSRADDDGYGDMWGEMTLLLEGSKDAASESSAVEHTAVIEEQNECDHSFVLNDDLGYVCHTCGLIHKRIETIFDFLWLKDNQMSIKGSDWSFTNDNGYGDMQREMSQLTMSECYKINR